MSIGDRVRERREALGMNQAELARAVKARGGSLSQVQISSLEAGAVNRPRSLPELALALRTTVQWLLDSENSAHPMQEERNDAVIIPMSKTAHIATAAEPLIVWRSVPSTGRSGETLIYKDQTGQTSRPIELAYSREAFAVLVVDDESFPRYERRDTLLVDPSTTPAEGDDCLFVRNPSDNPVAGIARRLIKITPENWIVRRFARDARDQKLDRSEWRAAWHIFGSYNRR